MDKINSEISFIGYEPSRRGEWNDFVKRSSNGVFMFDRAYMDYHSDRFHDCSLMAFVKGKLKACLPANIGEDKTLISHGGLTFGGWILPGAHFDGRMVESLVSQWVEWCKDSGFKRIIYKPIPWVMSPMPAQEDLYALWKAGFQLEKRLLSSAIYLDNNPGFNMSKRQQLRQAEKAGRLTVVETNEWEGFHKMLCECLLERHEASPVHSLQELKLLHERFPRNIRLFTACSENKIMAGTVIYDTGFTAHTQYMATSAQGRELNALTFLIHNLLTDTFSRYRLFDFGTSNLPDGSLHASLLEQKYSLGGRGVVYETYALDL